MLWKTLLGNEVNFISDKFSVPIALNGCDITLYGEFIPCQAVLNTSNVHHLVKSLEFIFFEANLTLEKGVLENFLGFWLSNSFLRIYLPGTLIHRWKDVRVSSFITVTFIIVPETAWTSITREWLNNECPYMEFCVAVETHKKCWYVWMAKWIKQSTK